MLTVPFELIYCYYSVLNVYSTYVCLYLFALMCIH